jgi:hypothetical protein
LRATARHDLVQATSGDIDDVELAVVALTEGSNRVVGEVEQLLCGEAGAARHEAPNSAATVVGEQIAADERRQRTTSVDVATGNREA